MNAQERVSAFKKDGFSDTQIKDFLCDGEALGRSDLDQETVEEMYDIVNNQGEKKMNQLQITPDIQHNIIIAMQSNPEKWGSSNWNLAVDVDDGTASIDHNTLCYNECCANRNVVVTSMYGFDTNGWFDCVDDNYTVIGSVDEWAGSELFSISSLSEMFNEEF